MSLEGNCPKSSNKRFGEAQVFLGIEVVYSRSGIFISQQNYLLDLLKGTWMIGCKPVDIPMILNHKHGEAKEDTVVDCGRYQRVVGKLIYLSHTCPNIAYAVSVAIEFMYSPREVHLEVVHRIFYYLNFTQGKEFSLREMES